MNRIRKFSKNIDRINEIFLIFDSHANIKVKGWVLSSLINQNK